MNKLNKLSLEDINDIIKKTRQESRNDRKRKDGWHLHKLKGFKPFFNLKNNDIIKKNLLFDI